MSFLKAFLTVLTGFLGLVGGILAFISIFVISVLLTILFTDLQIKIRDKREPKEEKEPTEEKEPQDQESKDNLCKLEIPEEPDKFYTCDKSDNCNDKYVVKKYTLLKNKNNKELACAIRFKHLNSADKTGVIFLWIFIVLFGIISFAMFITLIVFIVTVSESNRPIRRRRVYRPVRPIKVVRRPVRVVRPLRPRRPIRRR